MAYEECNNRAYVRGIVASVPVFSHEVCGEGFFETEIISPRLSNQEDVVPITVSERFIKDFDIKLGKEVTFSGQFRSYNKLFEGKSKLILTLFVREVLENDYSKSPNMIALSGYICKPTIYRTTPFSREIGDMLVAVNRSYNKSDYIPCIAWGRNARFTRHLEVGEKVALIGRMQSRKYMKTIGEEQEQRTAFEVSLSKISVGENVNKLQEECDNFFDSIRSDSQGEMSLSYVSKTI